MSRSLRTGRALILEDEPRYRSFLADVLRDMEFVPVQAGTAEEALRQIGTEAPDMLLLDLNLPVTDGMTFLERFREDCPHTPVVIITGFGDLASARKAIRFGVSDFLTKPCDLGQLEAAIDRARRRPSAGAAETPSLGTVPEEASIRSLASMERDAIIQALRSSGGNRSAAARTLGISRRSLYNKITQYIDDGVDVP